MAKELNFEKELIGCFGDPIWENPTEAMVEAAFAHHGMKFRYVTTEVKAENLKAAVEGVKAMGYEWFYEKDDQLRTDAELLGIRLITESRGANLLLDVPPDTRGLVPEETVAALMRLEENYARQTIK
jgi:alpha-L-fucosidase